MAIADGSPMRPSPLPSSRQPSAISHQPLECRMPTRILIVEDDPDIAALVARYLDKAGFTTERAASGREALQAVAARVPELLVLDLMLPHVDGLEVCRLLR